MTPDHYVFRMLYSQGVQLEDLGLSRLDGANKVVDGRKIWSFLLKIITFFVEPPSKMWIDHSFENVFGLTDAFSPKTADTFYDHIAECLNRDEFRPRELQAFWY